MMYSITFDPDTRTMVIVTGGFWSIATVAAFSTELVARGMAARLQRGPFAVLVDARAAPIQPQEVIASLEKFMPRALKLTSAPIACVAGSHLGKLQTERYLKGDNCRTFLDLEDAKAWIEAERRPLAA